MKYELGIKNNEQGVGIIDIVISVTIITIALFSIIQLVVLGVRLQRESDERTRAIYLAEEGMEAVRLLRDQSWSSSINPLLLDTDYFPVVSSSQWVLSTTDPGLIGGLYTRTVRFGRVFRNDATDDIAPSGTEDPNTREVKVRVFWGGTGAKSYEIVTYLTNFLFN